MRCRRRVREIQIPADIYLDVYFSGENNIPEGKMKVFILGSCVSRDVLNKANYGEFEIVEYVARSSIGSIFAASPFPDTFSARLSSPFQSRIVRMDILKETAHLLTTIDPDVILMDLIDERFYLLETAPGSICTLSVQFKQTGALDEIAGARVIAPTSDEYMRYWTGGWVALVALLKSRSMLHKVRVNAVQWCRQTQSGARMPGPTVDQIDSANVTLKKMYARMAQDLDASQFFRYSDDVMQCPDDHHWEVAPFHYCEAFNQAALTNLRQVKQETMTCTAA